MYTKYKNSKWKKERERGREIRKGREGERERDVFLLYLKNKRKEKRKRLILPYQGLEVSVTINESSIQILNEHFDKPTEKKN